MADNGGFNPRSRSDAKSGIKDDSAPLTLPPSKPVRWRDVWSPGHLGVCPLLCLVELLEATVWVVRFAAPF